MKNRATWILAGIFGFVQIAIIIFLVSSHHKMTETMKHLGFSGSTGSAADILKVRGLKIVNAQGEVLASLEGDEDNNVSLSFYKGKDPQLDLGIYGNQKMLRMLDDQNHLRASLVHDSSGTLLSFADQDPQIHIDMLQGKSTLAVLLAQKNQNKLILGNNNESLSLIMERDDHRRWSVVSGDDFITMDFNDKNKQPRLSLGNQTIANSNGSRELTSEGHITIMDKNGNIVRHYQ